jgi:hypothetical protein
LFTNQNGSEFKNLAPFKPRSITWLSQITNSFFETVYLISNRWHFESIVFSNYLTFTLAGEMDRSIIPTNDHPNSQPCR